MKVSLVFYHVDIAILLRFTTEEMDVEIFCLGVQGGL